MLQYHIELRPFHLGLSLTSLHGNAEQPSAYTAWLAVLDHVLPTKGVQYRMTRSNHKDSESPGRVLKEQVNLSLALVLNSRFLANSWNFCPIIPGLWE